MMIGRHEIIGVMAELKLVGVCHAYDEIVLASSTGSGKTHLSIAIARTGGQLLFHLVSRLYERTPIIVTTTNLAFGE